MCGRWEEESNAHEKDTISRPALDVCLWKDGQAKASEVFIEGEAGNVIEQRRHDHERDGIAERQAMIAGIGPKHAFRFVSHAVAIGNKLKIGFDIAEKGERGSEVTPVSKQRHCLTDDIPGRAPRCSRSGRFLHEEPGAHVVDVVRIEAGIEE